MALLFELGFEIVVVISFILVAIVLFIFLTNVKKKLVVKG